MSDTGIRAEAYRRSAESRVYFLLFWAAVAAISAWFFGWWALIPAAFSAWTMIRIMSSLAKENRLGRGREAESRTRC